MSSVRLKLTALIVFISLFAVALVGVTARQVTSSQFDRLRLEQAKDTFLEVVSEYYAANGSWKGVQQYLASLPRRPQSSAGVGGVPDRTQGGATEAPPRPPVSSPSQAGAVLDDRFQWQSAFALSDVDGNLVVATGVERGGSVLPKALRNRGDRVRVDGEVVGTVVSFGPPELHAVERAYLRRINRWLLLATGLVGSVALVVGIIASGSFLRPVRDITLATRAMRSGSLAQSVPVRSNDEFGEMAVAFNDMSAEVVQSLHMRDQLTADVAHELRSPLTVLLGYLEGIRDGVLSATPETISTMFQEAVHLDRLVEDLRVLSLADAGRLAPQLESVTVAELLNGAVATFAAAAAQGNVRLGIDTTADIGLVEVDPSRMRQVLSNLVSNALRHTPREGTVTLRARRTTAATIIEVIDTGEGIAEADLARVFERFYRSDPARSNDVASTGLGLAIARSWVEAHGGTLEVSSTSGTGTTMRIELPERSAGSGDVQR